MSVTWWFLTWSLFLSFCLLQFWLLILIFLWWKLWSLVSELTLFFFSNTCLLFYEIPPRVWHINSFNLSYFTFIQFQIFHTFLISSLTHGFFRKALIYLPKFWCSFINISGYDLEFNSTVVREHTLHHLNSSQFLITDWLPQSIRRLFIS
jgi:hypothetical protein